jgi:hypothetical protein
MTRKQAITCMCREIPVENKNDEDFKTGIIVGVSPYSDHAAVSWDTHHDGETETFTLRDLVMQYPEQLEVA